jgi:rod shape-determining protein MreC
MLVVTPDGVAGKIIAVYPQSAQVLLITDPSSGAGSLLQDNRIQGVLKGTGRGLCKLDYVMNEDAVSPGDRVVTSGLDQIFPKGLPLGTVVKVGEGNIYKEIVVKPAVALDRLEEVLVVTSKPAAPEEARSPAH